MATKKTTKKPEAEPAKPAVSGKVVGPGVVKREKKLVEAEAEKKAAETPFTPSEQVFRRK